MNAFQIREIITHLMRANNKEPEQILDEVRKMFGDTVADQFGNMTLFELAQNLTIADVLKISEDAKEDE